jgi:hypothetical protein
MRPALGEQGCAHRHQHRCGHFGFAITDSARLREIGVVGDAANEMGKIIHDAYSLSLEKSIVNHIMKNNYI